MTSKKNASNTKDLNKFLKIGRRLSHFSQIVSLYELDTLVLYRMSEKL